MLTVEGVPLGRNPERSLQAVGIQAIAINRVQPQGQHLGASLPPLPRLKCSAIVEVFSIVLICVAIPWNHGQDWRSDRVGAVRCAEAMRTIELTYRRALKSISLSLGTPRAGVARPSR